MKLEYVPLLRIMRELHDIPRGQPPDFNGMRRFREYLSTIFPADDAANQLLPLLAMNPMGKDHVAAMLDALLAMDADGLGIRIVTETAALLGDVSGDFNVGLVIADDKMGAGTNRYDYEFSFRFGSDAERLAAKPRGRPKWLKAAWITGVLWSSETPTVQGVREALLTAVYRTAYREQHGLARTLREMLVQEGQVMSQSGCTGPVLDAEDISYTREVLAPLLDADDMRTGIECLFGDEAARSLGFTTRGLSPWAGLALALNDARNGSRIS
jgi:hypothetical protein